jgi:hypothetical protein
MWGSKICVDYTHKNYSTKYNLNDIKLENDGVKDLQKNIENVFYEWLTYLL